MAKVLVIEDDQFLRELMLQKLEQGGFDMEGATNGEDGVKEASAFHPDIILLDLILPGIDGFEVLKRIKENKNTSSIPVIILSNLGQQDDVEKGLKLGATDFMIKAHFTPGEIVAKIQSVLSGE